MKKSLPKYRSLIRYKPLFSATETSKFGVIETRNRSNFPEKGKYDPLKWLNMFLHTEAHDNDGDDDDDDVL